MQVKTLPVDVSAKLTEGNMLSYKLSYNKMQVAVCAFIN